MNTVAQFWAEHALARQIAGWIASTGTFKLIGAKTQKVCKFAACYVLYYQYY